jgi:hypothetical protein
VQIEARRCLPIAIVYCARLPWFGGRAPLTEAQRFMELRSMKAICEVSDAVVDVYLHGTYAQLVFERYPGDLGVRSMLICDNRGDDAYCRALQHYIAQQKGTNLDILSCHIIQLFHSRRRNISFMCFKIHQDDALNNQRFYMNLFSQHIVGSAPNGEYELRYGSLPLSLQYIQPTTTWSCNPIASYTTRRMRAT